jgi:D-alanine-D-alanine ligase-like ATP-grasp enzyme
MVRNYAGLDFIVSPTRGIYLLEINTQPQLLENSPFKVAMSEAGITADEFVGSVLKNL